jgi:hypothetical protein
VTTALAPQEVDELSHERTALLDTCLDQARMLQALQAACDSLQRGSKQLLKEADEKVRGRRLGAGKERLGSQVFCQVEAVVGSRRWSTMHVVPSTAAAFDPARSPLPAQLAASAQRLAVAERELAEARADAMRSESEKNDLQKKLVWWQEELQGAQAEADLYATAAKAARLEATRAAAALKEGFSAAAAAFARGLERSVNLAASEGGGPSGSKRSARRW